jgi:hypothetical protein
MEALKVLQSLLRFHSDVKLINMSKMDMDSFASKEAIRNTANAYNAVNARVGELLKKAADAMAQRQSKSSVFYEAITMNTVTFQELKDGTLDAIGADIGHILAENGTAIKADNAESIEKALAAVAKSEERLKRDKEALGRAQKRIKLMDYAEKNFPA